MGVRSGPKEMYQKDRSSSGRNSGTGLVTSLMRSWKITSSSSVSISTSTTTAAGATGMGPASSKRRTSGGVNHDSAMSRGQQSLNGRRTSSSSAYSSPLKHSNTTPTSVSDSTESPRGPFYSGGGGNSRYSLQQHRSDSNSHKPHHQTNGNSKSGRYFRDLDEDWSAVIDDYNMPIPTIANGGLSTTSSNPGTPHGGLSRKSTVSLHGRQSFSYPQLPQLRRSVSSERKSQWEIEKEVEAQELDSKVKRIAKFDCILNSKHVINQQELRQISWNGIPKSHRPKVWKLLIGYLPANTKRQEHLLKRKRQEYSDGLAYVFSEQHKRDMPTWHQIEIDIPRTNPQIPLYQFKTIQESLQNVLYLWAIRHPASGYVQGINDIVTPFLQTFLTEYLPPSQIDDVEKIDPVTYMNESQLKDLEADTFWCLTKLLEQITDNYIHGQPGILKQVKNLSQLVKRIDGELYQHFQDEHVEFIQFSFRWMNCLLMREFSMSNVIRMWDTYLSETSVETTSLSSPVTPTQPTVATFGPTTPGEHEAIISRPHDISNTTTTADTIKANEVQYSSLNEFHVFVCAAFLIKWSDHLMEMDFQEIITFLQNPPTADWKETDIEMLLGEAYIWQSLYKDATSHWL